MKTHLGVEVQLYELLTSAQGGGECQLHYPTALTPDNDPDTHRIRGWVGRTAGLNAVRKTNVIKVRSCRICGQMHMAPERSSSRKNALTISHLYRSFMERTLSHLPTLHIYTGFLYTKIKFCYRV